MVFLGAMLYAIMYIIFGAIGAVFLSALIVAIGMTRKHYKVPAIILYCVAGVALAGGIAFAIYLGVK